MDYLREIGFGILHIPKGDFLIMTPREVVIAYKGYLKNQEALERNESLRARQIAYMVYCSIPLKKGHNHSSIGDFWPINEGEGVKLSKEDRMEAYKRAKF